MRNISVNQAINFVARLWKSAFGKGTAGQGILSIYGGVRMVKVTFMYKDAWSKGEWRTQTCVVGSVNECIRIYGLGVDCEYKILSVEKVDS